MANDRRSHLDAWAGRPVRDAAAAHQLDALVAGHADVFDLLLDATESLVSSQWATPTGCPGWDVHDQLAHCVGVERCLLRELPSTAAPDSPDRAGEQALLRAVEADVRARRGVPHERLRQEAALTFAERLLQLRSLGAEAMDEEMIGPGGVRAKGAGMLRLRIFDLVAHEQDIRRALGRPREPAGIVAGLVAEHLLRTWSRHWRRAVPGPGELLVEVEGERPASTTVELAGHGRPERRAHLRGPLSALLPLACGRSDAPGGAAVFAEGDECLARRAIAAAGITP